MRTVELRARPRQEIKITAKDHGRVSSKKPERNGRFVRQRDRPPQVAISLFPHENPKPSREIRLPERASGWTPIRALFT
jgi:hypothetical protein